jgi:hypothetical protein
MYYPEQEKSVLFGSMEKYLMTVELEARERNHHMAPDAFQLRITECLPARSRYGEGRHSETRAARRSIQNLQFQRAPLEISAGPGQQGARNHVIVASRNAAH